MKKAILSALKDWDLDYEVDEFLKLWFESENHLNTSMIDYINQLRIEGLSCFLATNQEKYRTNFMRNEMGLANIFDSIYSSADLGYRKPDQNFFFSLLEEVKLEPNEVLFVDDSVRNVESAEQVGIRSHHFHDLDAFKRFVIKNR